MRKSFTLLFAALLACAQMMAQLPTVSTAPADGAWNADTKWYTISGDNGKYISLNNVDADGNFKLNNSAKPGTEGLWCVVGNTENGYQFYNYKSGISKILGATGKEENGRMTMYDVTNNAENVTTSFDIDALEGQTGYAFVKNHGSKNDWWNSRDSYLAYWNSDYAYNADCTGSQYVFTEIVDFEAFLDVPAVKAAAKATLESMLTIDILFTEATINNAIAELETVSTEGTFAELSAALDNITAILNKVYADVEGKNVRFTTLGRNADNGGLDITAATAGASETANSGDAGIWTLSYDANNGAFKMYNFVTNLYMGATSGQSARVATCKTFAEAAPYKVNVKGKNVVNLLNNGNTLHANGWGSIVQWNDNDSGASIWNVISCAPIAITQEQYSAASQAASSLPYAIQQAYGLVTDATKFSSNAQQTGEGSIEALLDNAYSSYFHSSWSDVIGDYHYLQAEVSEEVKDFYFYFKKREQNNNNRPTEIEVQGSSDGTAFTTITTIKDGLPTNASVVDYISGKISAENNVKHLRFVVKSTNNNAAKEGDEAHPFFTFSEFYIFPATNDITSLLEAYNSFAAASITEESKATAAAALINAESVLALSNIKKEVAAILAANASNHAVVPAVGQYTTAAYNALNAAYTADDATQESLEAAITAFKVSKNLPIFTIDGVIEYAAGKSIYDNPSSVNDKGNTHYFKSTNLFDKSMWWALDMAETAVSVTEKVDIYNVGTGNGFWGTSSIKITETDPSVADDGIFLFYTTGDATPIHAQNSGQLICRYGDKGAASGSAWKFTYIGCSYELNKLTDNHVVALSALQAAYNANKHLTDVGFGTALGQYSGNKEALATALAQAEAISAKSIAEIAAMNEADIKAVETAITEGAAQITLNAPQAGKYYRIKAVAEWNDDAPYLGSANSTAKEGRAEFIADGTSAHTIFLFDGESLQNYETKKSLVSNNNFLGYSEETTTASKIAFYAASNGLAGAFNISFNDDQRWLYCHKDNYTDGGGRGTENGYCFNIEEVTELPNGTGEGEGGEPTDPNPGEGEGEGGEPTDPNPGEGEGEGGEPTDPTPGEGEGEGEGGEPTDPNPGEGEGEGEGGEPTDPTPGEGEGEGEGGDDNTGEGEGGDDNTGEGEGGDDNTGEGEGGDDNTGEGEEEEDSSIDNAEVDMEKAVIYDLLGRRIEKIVEKGIYIVNGKKVVIK